MTAIPQWVLKNADSLFALIVESPRVSAPWVERPYLVMDDHHCCPKCKGPSLRGDLCFNCTKAE